MCGNDRPAARVDHKFAVRRCDIPVFAPALINRAWLCDAPYALPHDVLGCKPEIFAQTRGAKRRRVEFVQMCIRDRGHGCAGPYGRARRTRRRDVRRNGGRGRSAAGRLCDLFLHNALGVDKAAQSRVNGYQKEGMHHGTAAVCMPEVRKYGV